MTTYRIGDRVRLLIGDDAGREATVSIVHDDATSMLIVRDGSHVQTFVKPSMVELVTPRPQYTDEDVQRLVNEVKRAIPCPDVPHDIVEAFQRALAPFQAALAAYREHDRKAGAR